MTKKQSNKILIDGRVWITGSELDAMLEENNRLREINEILERCMSKGMIIQRADG